MLTKRGPGFGTRKTIDSLARPSLRLTLAALFYLVGAAVCTFPLVLHLADALLPAPDPLHESWILAWDIHALTTDPLHLYDANVYFPFPLSLTYSDAMLSGAIMIAPVLLLTGQCSPGAQRTDTGVLVDRRSRDVPARPNINGKRHR